MNLTGKTLGDYKVLRQLGQGGMGQVYLAEQISLKRKVALKIMRPDLAVSEISLARFKAEALNVARVTHANIVQVYAITEIDGMYMMALEYVEGRNLREYLEKKGPPEILLGLSIMRQVAAALQRASELGIIHRDIKPENILLTRKGEVKVADFGLSRIFADDGVQSPNLTKSDVTLGTPLYMSPEQVEGKKNIDHRTDIYSFGVTCYHMFAGHPPFKGTAAFEVAVQHVQKEPTPLAEIRPDLPPELPAIIHKMMAKNPDARYQLAREIIRDVAKLRDAVVGVSATMNLPPTSTPAAPTPHSLDIAATLPLPRPSVSRWPRRLLFTSLPLIFALGLFFAWAGNHSVPFSPAALPPDVPIIEEPNSTPKPDSSVLEREKTLLTIIKDLNSKATDAPSVNLNLKYSMELGLLYLNDRQRYGDGEKFFNSLIGKQMFVFKTLGRLGMGMVLAFKDEPEKSNKWFMLALDNKAEKGNPVWKYDRPWREMIAKALNCNLQNSPATFPERIKPYLHPPAATLKGP
jgi:eukaryotic-like serine/threonine-protein kinase